MHIVIFGASGKVGRQVAQQLLAEGYDITAFVHRHNPLGEHERLSIVQGDIHDTAAVTSAVEGSDVVICTLGSWHTKSKDIVSSGMRAIIPAMEQQNVRRLISLTGAGALWQGDKPTIVDRLNHRLLSITAPKILHDGEEHLALLAASKLDWTCLRSPVMTNGKHTTYHLSKRLPSLFALTPRKAIVRAIIDQLQDDSWKQQAPVVYRRG